MKAIKFNEFGGPEVLELVEVDEPHAGPGQVRIAVRAAGVNPAEWKIRAGYFKDFMPVEFPAGVGFEASGMVDEVGEGVSGVAVGDAVFGAGIGTFADYAVLNYWTAKPDAMPFDVDGGMTVASETAIRSLDYVGAKAGETILISGAAGGVGSVAVQVAKARGITVIGTASEAKHDYLSGLGATPTTYEPGLADRLKTLAPEGIDATLDLVGAGNIPELIQITGEAGYLNRRFLRPRTWCPILAHPAGTAGTGATGGSAALLRGRVGSTHRKNLPPGSGRPSP